MPRDVTRQIVESEGKDERAQDRLEQDFPLCRFAATCWGYYAQTVDAIFIYEEVFDLFSHPISPYLAIWSWVNISPHADMSPQHYCALYLARFGLLALLKHYCLEKNILSEDPPIENVHSDAVVQDDSGRGTIIRSAADRFAALGGFPQVMTFGMKGWGDLPPGLYAGRAPLLHAILGGDIQTVADVLEAGQYPVNEPLPTQEATIYYAIGQGTRHFHFAPDMWKNPFDCAAATGHEEIVQLLLDKGFRPNVLDRSVTREENHAAATQIWCEAVNVPGLLHIELHASPTSLICAVAGGHTRIVQRLLEAGADPNLSSQKYLAQLNEWDLRLPGADIILDIYGSILPLHVAVSFGHEEIVQLLLVFGANPNLVIGGCHNETAVTVIVHEWTVVAKNFVVNSHRAQTALTYAAARGYTNIARMLIGAGAVLFPSTSTSMIRVGDMQATLEDCDFTLENMPRMEAIVIQNPLICAVAGGYPEMLKLLLNAPYDLSSARTAGIRVSRKDDS